MYKKYSTKFNKPMVIIYPGEYYATEEDEGTENFTTNVHELTRILIVER